MTGQLADAVPEHGHDRLGEERLVQVNDVLNNVVSERVLHEDPGVVGDALNQPDLLVTGCVVDASLEDTATVTMRSDFDTVAADRIKDELGIRSAELVQALLDDMVAVQVLDQLNHLESESFSDDLDLLCRADVLNHFLESTSAMLVERDANHVPRGVLDQNGSLFIIAKLEELLAQIITKWIRHEFDDVLVGLNPNGMNLVGVAFLQLLLEVAAAMLVLAQVIDLIGECLEGHVLVSGHCYGNVSSGQLGWQHVFAYLRCRADGDVE